MRRTNHHAPGERDPTTKQVCEEAKRALVLDSENAAAHFILAIALASREPEAALEFALQARALRLSLSDPQRIAWLATRASALYQSAFQ